MNILFLNSDFVETKYKFDWLFYDEKGSSRICFQKMKKQVRSDYNASEVDILGHFGTFKDILGNYGTLWDNLNNFMTSLEH